MLPDKIKAIVDGLSFTGGHPTAFVAYSDDLTYTKSESNYICHMPLRYCLPKTVNNIVTLIDMSDDAAPGFFDFLINRHFKDYGQYVEIDTHGSRTYLHITGLDKWPTNVLMSFIIASRIPHEFRGSMFKTWIRLTNKGIDPGLALCLSYWSIPADLDKPISAHIDYLAGNSNHWHLCYQSSDWTQVIKGEMNPQGFSKLNFFEKPKCHSSVTEMWCKDGGDPINIRSFTGKSVNQIQEHFIKEGIISG